MTVLRTAVCWAACTLIADSLGGQGSPHADTVRASCALAVPQPRQCALERLGARLQQVTGSPEALVYDAAVQRFRGTQSHRIIPATVTYEVDSQDMRAKAVLVAPAVDVPAPTPVAPTRAEPAVESTAHGAIEASRTSPPPPRIDRPGPPIARARPDRTSPPPAPASAPRDLAIAPLTPTRVVIGHATPTPIAFGVRRIVGTDTMPVLPSKVECRVPRRAGLTVVRTRIEPTGAVTCWVLLELRADATRPVTLRAEMRVDKAKSVGTAVIEPVRVPLVAIRSTDAACNELAERVTHELLERGRPVVRWEHATRRLQLEHCEQLARLLPARNREIAPTGFYVRGEASEPRPDGELNPEVNGPFEFTVTKAGVDPMIEAVREVVDRLLKYRGL